MFFDAQSLAFFQVRADALNKGGTDEDDDQTDEQPGQRHVGKDVIGRRGNRVDITVERVTQDQNSQHRNDDLPRPDMARYKETDGSHVGQDIGDQDEEDADSAEISKQRSTVHVGHNEGEFSSKLVWLLLHLSPPLLQPSWIEVR